MQSAAATHRFTVSHPFLQKTPDARKGLVFPGPDRTPSRSGLFFASSIFNPFSVSVKTFLGVFSS